MKINWCKIGLHNYVCYYSGVYKCYHRCKHCGKEKSTIGSRDNKN